MSREADRKFVFLFGLFFDPEDEDGDEIGGACSTNGGEEECI
jgi:hypothetical protein